MTSKHSRVERGVLGTKLGMTQVFDENNRIIPVTAVSAGPCVVTQVRKPETDGYSAIQIGYGEIEPRKVTKPMKGHFSSAGVPPRRHLAEIRTEDAASYEVGQQITLDIFEPGQTVDVTGTSKGKGYAGVMKRHGFAGVGASHGAHRNHRKPGSIGGASTPGRVFKGLRMAGRMGNERVTTTGLEVVRVDTDRGLLLIKGAIPGNAKGVVYVRNSVKTPTAEGADK